MVIKRHPWRRNISFDNLVFSIVGKVFLAIEQTPLEDGPLKDAIQKMSEKTGFKLDNVYVMDGSKRSTKANAYFTGLGSKKRIVLYDTLINDLTIEEIVAVLAHEIGHYKKKHSLKGTISGLLRSGCKRT